MSRGWARSRTHYTPLLLMCLGLSISRRISSYQAVTALKARQTDDYKRDYPRAHDHHLGGGNIRRQLPSLAWLGVSTPQSRRVVASTSFEREFAHSDYNKLGLEWQTYWYFVRRAPHWLPPHLVPGEDDAAAWLGLIQHYGGPTGLSGTSGTPVAWERGQRPTRRARLRSLLAGNGIVGRRADQERLAGPLVR